MEITMAQVLRYMPKEHEAMRRHPNKALFAEIKKSLREYLPEFRDPAYISLIRRTWLERHYETTKIRVAHPEKYLEFLSHTRFSLYPDYESLLVLAHGQLKFMLVLCEKFIFKGHPYLKQAVDEDGNPIPEATEEELAAAIPFFEQMHINKNGKESDSAGKEAAKKPKPVQNVATKEPMTGLEAANVLLSVKEMATEKMPETKPKKKHSKKNKNGKKTAKKTH